MSTIPPLVRDAAVTTAAVLGLVFGTLALPAPPEPVDAGPRSSPVGSPAGSSADD